MYVISRVTLPLSVRQLLIVLETHQGDDITRKGLPYSFALAAAALLSALAQNQTAFLSTKSGIAMRAALISAIYEHALRLTPAGRRGLTTGEITNLVATDTHKIYDVMVEAHNIWSCPLLLVIVAVLLWAFMGPELTIGIAILIAFLPVVRYLVNRMLVIRKERSRLADVRIDLLTAMLQGIQVTKINHYESQIEEQISEVREKEMGLLKKELRMWGWVLTFSVVSPVTATFAAFVFYALVNSKNIMTPSGVFSSLLLFSILRFPINLTARLIGKTAQASEALRRIAAFFEREVRPYSEPISQSKNIGHHSRKITLDVKNGCFAITPEADKLNLTTSFNGKSESTCVVPAKEKLQLELDEYASESALPVFTVRNINLQVARSELLAIIGKVGSGKTVLLRSLLGELEAQDDADITLDGVVSYASQQPFILNASLRENILFGSEFDSDMYDRVLDACCLRPDILRLGPAGDLTEIGERGVTLSGGNEICVDSFSQTDLVSKLYHLLYSLRQGKSSEWRWHELSMLDRMWPF